MTDLTHAFGDRSMIVPLVAAGLGVLGPVVETIVPSPIRIAVGDAPIVVAVVLTLLATDLANYGIHRALHRGDPRSVVVERGNQEKLLTSRGLELARSAQADFLEGLEAVGDEGGAENGELSDSR